MIEDINKALEILRQGGIILFPNDTIWGIGCDATNFEAIEKVYKLKQRHDSKSLLVLTDNPNRITSYVDVVPEIAWELLEVNDAPLTIIYPKAKNLPDNLVAKDGSVGIRVTTEAFSSQLLQRFRKPLVSTSANISGKPYPVNFTEIDQEIINGVDYVVKYRQEENRPGKPSSIIKLGVNGEVEIIRK